MTKFIEATNHITELVKQIVTHADGSVGIIERERVTGTYKTEKEVKVIWGSEALGYGYIDAGMYIFSGISDRSLELCKKIALTRNFPKWDSELN